MNEKVAYVHITSWLGSLGAEHYYGKLHCVDYENFPTVELERTLTAGQAKYFNEKDRCHSYHKGSTTTRFDTQDDIINLAISTYREYYPQATVLLLGHDGSNPYPVIDGIPEYAERLNAIFAEQDEYYFTQRGDTPEDMEKDRLYSEWFALLGEATGYTYKWR